MKKRTCAKNTAQEVVVNPYRIESLTVIKILEIKDNDRLFTRFLRANYGFIKNIVKRYSNYSHLSEDMFQVGCMGLHDAIMGYDASRTSKAGFSGYASVCVNNKIKQMLEKEKDWKGKVTNFDAFQANTFGDKEHAYPQSNTPADLITSYYNNKHNVQNDFEAKIVNEIEIKSFMAQLEEMQRDIVKYRIIDGLSHREVAEILELNYYAYRTIWSRVVIPQLMQIRNKLEYITA